jgi:hypothetical protein
MYGSLESVLIALRLNDFINETFMFRNLMTTNFADFSIPCRCSCLAILFQHNRPPLAVRLRSLLKASSSWVDSRSVHLE